MNNNNTEIVAINEEIDRREVGALVYWSGVAPTPLARLQTAWDARGLDAELLPKAPTPAKALGVAMKTLSEKRKLVRPLEHRGVFALTIEHVFENADPIYDPVLRASASRDGQQLKVEAKVGYEHLVEPLRAAYDESLNYVTAVDVMSFLTGALRSLQAVALRPTGGFYFVPRQHIETLGRMFDAVHEACPNTQLFRIPAMTKKEAIDAISAAIREEADGEIAKVESEITQFYDSGETSMGKRALQTRLERLNTLREKLGTYESLLSTRLAEFHDRMELLAANVMRGIAALDNEADATS